MPDLCPKCGRRLDQKNEARIYGSGLDPAEICNGPEYASCRVAAAGRRAGLREAIEIAKAHAWADDDSGPDDDARDLWIDWSDVDAEIARRLGDG